MFDLKLKVQMRLNPRRLLREWKSPWKKTLMRQGAYVRRITRKLLKPGPAPPSPPGKPPVSQTGLLRNSIVFAWDAATESVVVGADFRGTMKTAGGPRTVPELLEYGGIVEREVARRDRLGRVRWRRVKSVYAPRPYITAAYRLAEKRLLAMWQDALHEGRLT